MRILADCGNFPAANANRTKPSSNAWSREIREELGVEISVGKLFESVTHAYPEKTVHLKFFVCRLGRGEPQPLGCAALKWVGEIGTGGL